jgi:Zn-finger nucleic acid-binding protein/ribosomal protein S27AE
MMKCPIDGSLLNQVKRHKMEVDECSKCKGMWLTPLQLDQLEDIKFNVDYLKGSILVSSVETSLPCPVCQAHLYEFNYRYHQLRLDHCPKQHGFWLDSSEDKRVLEIMVKRKEDAYRILGAETFWDKMIQNFRWFIYSKNPHSLSTIQSGKQGYLPPHIEARPPATPYKPQKLPSTCPNCGGPINSMTAIEDQSHQYTCGYCHAYIEPIK